jgi:soluble lytic murein transglycosylase-like protein
VFGADKKAEAVLCADFYADRYGVPRELVHAIIEVESGWRPYAVSEKGAAGLMQLMPATAVAFGVANRFRIEENVEAGVAYLAWLRKRFHGDLRLVTAAYFAGESRVSQQNLSYCSPEVYRYVSRVARVYWGKRSRAIHGEQSRGGAS